MKTKRKNDKAKTCAVEALAAFEAKYKAVIFDPAHPDYKLRFAEYNALWEAHLEQMGY